MSQEPAANRPRWFQRHLRLSMRGFMLLVLLVGGTLGWIVYRARIQCDAVATIDRAHGAVFYDYQWHDGKPIQNPPEPQPRILIKLMGPDYFHAVRAVMLGQSRAKDSLMKAVGWLDQLEDLDLDGSEEVTDAGLAHLRGLTHLKALDLRLTGVSGAGLKHLREMRRLEVLNLPFGGKVNDADLESLSRLTALEFLCLDASEISDAGLLHLRGLVNLRSLCLHNVRTGDNLSHLHSIKNNTRLLPLQGLEKLTARKSQRMDGSGLTDAGLVHLRGLVNLNELCLNGAVTTDGLVHLRGMTKLRKLSLHGTKVTSLEPLAHLRDLESLDLSDTLVDDSALARVEYMASMGKPTTLVVRGTKATKARVVRLDGPYGARLLVVESAQAP